MYTVYLNGEEVLTSISYLKRKIKNFLLLNILGNARTAGLYTAQYEQVFNVLDKKEQQESKRIIRVKAPVNDTIEPGKNEAPAEKPERPEINYFAGPHCVFDPRFKY